MLMPSVGWLAMIVAPVIAFWVSGVIGRYWYPRIVRAVDIPPRDTPLVRFDRSQHIPRVRVGDVHDRRQLTGSIVIILIGCYMAFSSGASNVANAVAPLVGSGTISMDAGVVLAGVAVAIGAMTIARRTLRTMANDITALPIPAAIVVMVVSATIVTLLSAIGIPVQLVIVTTMAIIGLGWGRASRTVTMAQAVQGEGETRITTGALRADETNEPIPPIGEEDPTTLPRTADLFDPSTTARVILIQNVVPLIATISAFLFFRYLPLV